MFLEGIGPAIVDLVIAGGYLAILLLQTVDSFGAPIPSEVVIPFGGYMAYLGLMDFWAVVFVATLGSMFGAWFSYYIGYKGGKPLRENEGGKNPVLRTLFSWANIAFNRYGEFSVFFTRMVPVIRGWASYPAGMCHMNLTRFSIYTCAGSFLWCLFLAYAGLALGSQWDTVTEVVLAFLLQPWVLAVGGVTFFAAVGVALYFIWYRTRRRGIPQTPEVELKCPVKPVKTRK